MKIEQVLVHYLIKNKQLTLQGIGTFRLDASVPNSTEVEKSFLIPENAITFEYDPRAREDGELVDFIVENTKKIKPLAASDLDSFLSLGRQFLNIGKPFILPHIGTLEKLNSGALAFKPGQLVADRMEPNKAKTEEEQVGEQEGENLFNDYVKERKKNSSGKTILMLLVLIIIAGVVWAVWKYAFSKKEEPSGISSTESILPVSDSALKKDSTFVADSLRQENASDSVLFNVIVSKYHSQKEAEYRFNKLKSYNRNVILYTDDSIIYKIAEPFHLPLSDTTRVLDSLKRYYAKVSLEIK